MGLFFAGDDEHHVEGMKRTGFARYRHVLERDFKQLAVVGFITLVFFIPFAAGVTYAVLSRSLLIAIGSGLLGGAIAGPGYACMVDLILRRMRNDLDDWGLCWRRAFRQNFMAAIAPGMVQCTFLAVLSFAFALILWGAAPITPGTLFILALAAILATMILSVWWPQVVLFQQTQAHRLKNSVLFCALHFGKMLGCALLQAAWWGACVLFMPWTAFLVPFLSVWYILLVSFNMIYTELDDDFRIEEQIKEQFPGRLAE